MALQVWLPLTKDLRNQGLASLTSSGTPVFKNSGKLGNKSLDLNTRISFTCSALADLTTFSVAFWSKVNDDTSLSTDWVDVIGFTDATSSGTTGQLRWETCYSSSNKSRGISSHDNATNAISNGFGRIFCNKNIWVHLTCTVDLANSSVKEYVNGELVYTHATNGGHLTGAFWLGQTGIINGEIQDVRIYDHALSQMEVKELSKGLVLHYPLNRQGWGQENLLKNSNFLQGTNGMQGYTATSATCTKQTDCMKVVSTSASGGFYSSNFDSITTGDMTIFSADVKANSNMTIYIGTDGSGNGSCQAYTVGTSWQRISISKAKTTNNANLRIYGNGTFYAKNLKYELGSIATPWCPNSADALATTMGINSTTEYDCSGFCNNGSKGGSGIISYTSDTPKYAVSTQLIGATVDSTSNTKTGAAYITGPCSLSNITALTVSWWAKIKKYGRGGLLDLTAFTSNFEEGTDYNTCPLSNWDSTFRLWDGTNAFNFFSHVAKDSQWHHYVVTFTSGSGKFYRDGVNIVNSGTMGNTLTNFNGVRTGLGKAGGVYRQINEDVSDLRIYATALSADDVKSLYQNSAYIDSSGNVYGAVHSEV